MHGMGGLGRGVVQGRQLIRCPAIFAASRRNCFQRTARREHPVEDEVGRRHGRDEIAAGQAVFAPSSRLPDGSDAPCSPGPLTVKV